MLKKRKLAKGKVRVTFSLPPLEGVARLNLVGDFNDWNQTATPMAQDADGSWSVVLTLEADRTYEYRYLADHQTWHNDEAADAYAPNPYGSENCVLNLAASEPPESAKEAPTRKTTSGA